MNDEVSEVHSGLANAQTRLGAVKKQMMSRIYFRAWQETLMEKIGAASDTLTVEIRGTRTSFMDDLEAIVGKDQMTTILR